MTLELPLLSSLSQRTIETLAHRCLLLFYLHYQVCCLDSINRQTDEQMCFVYTTELFSPTSFSLLLPMKPKVFAKMTFLLSCLLLF